MASPKRKRQRMRAIQESAPTLTDIRTEILDLDEAALRADGTVPIKLVSPGWGTSGYYSTECLEAAGTDRVFPRGTQMFWDHPSATEKQDRPERSLRDLAAVLETDATWRDDPTNGPGLYAQAKVFEAFKPLLAEMAPHIGVSIRAGAQVSAGQAEGRKGRLIERIVESTSVDFVTKAGRGGQVLAVLEAAGRTDLIEEAGNVGEWFQSRIHLDFTTRADDMFGDGRLTKEERIALSTGIGAALDAFSTTVEDLAPQLLDRDLWADPDSTANQTNESKESNMDDKLIQEAVATAVKAEVAAALTETKTELDETKAKLATAETELAEAKKAGETATKAQLLTEATAHVSGHDKVKALPAPAAAKVTAHLAESAEAGADGKLDTAKLDAAITEAVDAEVKYLAEAAGSPVRGMGGGDTATTADVTEATTTRLEETFVKLGATPESAKVMVGGRS